MILDRLLSVSAAVASPPPGSVNVRVGRVVAGPGGQWVPCATEVGRGVYYSGLFEVGPGHRQVCAADRALLCPDQALLRAIELATFAAEVQSRESGDLRPAFHVE